MILYRRLPAIKLHGANIVPTAGQVAESGYAWRNFYRDWINNTTGKNWVSWIKPQIDAAKSIGCNTIRLIGDCAGVMDGTFTQSAYLGVIRQAVQYCQSQNLYFYGSAGGPPHYRNVSNTALTTGDYAAIAAICAAYCQIIAWYPNTIGCDVIQEPASGIDYGMTFGASTSYQFPISVSAMQAFCAQCNAAIRAVAPNLALTYSFNRSNNSSAMWSDSLITSLLAYCDYVDMHCYYLVTSASDMDALRTLIGTTKQVLIGEHGAALNLGASTRAAWYNGQKLIVNRADVAGSLQWAITDQDTVTTDMWGLFDASFSPRSTEITAYQTFPKQPAVIQNAFLRKRRH